MKTFFLFFTIGLLFSQKNTNQLILKEDKKRIGEDTCKTMSSVNKFEIRNIDSVKTVYIIYAKRRDSIIKIVSKKDPATYCKPIVQGEFYDLEVKSLLEHTSSKRHIGGIKYNGMIIDLEGDKVIWDLFICENLKGLCLVPSFPDSISNNQK
jgi:hypothetical protein